MEEQRTVTETIKQPFLVPTPSFTSQNVAITTTTKPMPPPAARPRKRDLATINQRVVYPPKESCFG
jgi:uncharacterized protein